MKSKPQTSPIAFLAILFGIAFVVFFMPFGNWRDFKIMVTASAAKAPVFMSGTSVIKHFSPCDSDTRSISAITGEHAGIAVTDLSYGGQTLLEQVAYLGAALQNKHSRVLVASASLADTQGAPLPSLRRRLLFSLVSPVEVWNAGPSGAGVADLILGADVPLAFDYAGEHFPTYEYIKQKYFSIEYAGRRCPEHDGVNRKFVEAIYFGTYVNGNIDESRLQLIKQLAKEAASHGRSFLFVLQPIDFELIEGLRTEWGSSVRRKRDKILQELASAHVRVLDLTEVLTNADFADRWCACGHLQESGRRKVASALARALQAITKPVV